MKKILIGLVFSFLLTGCSSQTLPTEIPEENIPTETEKTEPMGMPPVEEAALPTVSEDASQESIVLDEEKEIEEPVMFDEEKEMEEQAPVVEEGEEIPLDSTEEVLVEEEEVGCMRKGAMCCDGEDCKGLAITCALGTMPELTSCDENCMLQAKCVTDPDAEETEPSFTENGECVFQNGMCCQGDLCAGIALNCVEGSMPTVTKCDEACVPQGECKTQ